MGFIDPLVETRHAKKRARQRSFFKRDIDLILMYGFEAVRKSSGARLVVMTERAVKELLNDLDGDSPGSVCRLIGRAVLLSREGVVITVLATVERYTIDRYSRM